MNYYLLSKKALKYRLFAKYIFWAMNMICWAVWEKHSNNSVTSLQLVLQASKFTMNDDN